MAQIFGQKSKYLIWMDYACRIAAFLIAGALVFLVYKYFSLNFGKQTSFLRIVVATAMYVPVFYLAKKHLYEYILESRKYFKGRKGEYSIYYELLHLPDEYLVFQDVRFPISSGNIDFVVVGPTGVFAIEVKSHAGLIGFNGTELMRNGRVFQEGNPLSQTMQGALRLNAYIIERIEKDYFVVPLLVFSNSKADVKFGFKSIKNVYVIKKGFLVEMITGYKPRLSMEETGKIKVELSKLIYPNRKK